MMHGSCLAPDVCKCISKDYFGVNCEIWRCFGYNKSDELSCSRHGRCATANGCACDINYFDEICNITKCTGILSNRIATVCSGHGTCWPEDFCNCSSMLYQGHNCEITSCHNYLSDNPRVCGSRGMCWPFNHCLCDKHYFGVSCGVTTCYGVNSNDTAVVCGASGSCVSYDHCEFPSSWWSRFSGYVVTGIAVPLIFVTYVVAIISFGFVGFTISGCVLYSRQVQATKMLLQKKMKLDELEETNLMLSVDPSLFVLKWEEISYDNITDVIGTGGSGSIVYVATYQKVRIAFKKFRLFSAIDVKNFVTEFQILSGVNHPYIIGVISGCMAPGGVGIAMEYCKNGDLKQYMESAKVSLPNRMRFLFEIATGMGVLHSKKILHRDLKMCNVLISNDGTCKIMDFGLSRILGAQSRTQALLGTPGYIAPELFRVRGYSFPADVFSFSMIMWQLCCYDFEPYAFDGSQMGGLDLRVANDPKLRPPLSDVTSEIPEVVCLLIARCWKDNPEDRPTFSKIADILELVNQGKIHEAEQCNSSSEQDQRSNLSSVAMFDSSSVIPGDMSETWPLLKNSSIN